MSATFTIGEASASSGMSPDALRYYEEEGIIGPFERDAANHRLFTASDLAWIAVINCMKEAGLAIADLRTFASLLRDGDASADPLAFLSERRATLQARATALTKAIAVLDDKIVHFGRTFADADSPSESSAQIRVHGELRCGDAGQAKIVADHLARHVALTRAEPGCISFDVTPTDDPFVWKVEEWFTDRRALEAHQARGAESEWGRLTKDFGHHYEVSEGTLKEHR